MPLCMLWMWLATLETSWNSVGRTCGAQTNDRHSPRTLCSWCWCTRGLLAVGLGSCSSLGSQPPPPPSQSRSRSHSQSPTHSPSPSPTFVMHLSTSCTAA
jgi:hypothetical protein